MLIHGNAMLLTFDFHLHTKKPSSFKQANPATKSQATFLVNNAFMVD